MRFPSNASRDATLACAALALVGCADLSLDTPTAGPPPSGYVGTAPLRRLSNAEYLHSLRDLFGGVVPEALPDLPDDTRVSGFENDARSLGPSDVRIARYEQIAFAFTSLATEDDAALARTLSCASWTSATEQDACGRSLVTEFGRRAFRRPLSDDEVERYSGRFRGFRSAIDFPAAVQLTLMALVQAPAFLYRIELPSLAGPTADDPSIAPIDDFALATRLAFFVWESTPDDELLDLAASGELREPDVLEAQVDRMLADARAVDAMVDFHRQWLDFDRILVTEHESRDPAQFPSWSESLQRATREELSRFVAWELTEGDGTLGSLFTSRHTLVNDELAALYGVEGPGTPGAWSETDLPSGERAGLLTRAAILASHSHAASISPPVRAAFVLERVLCRPHLSPPAAADLSPPMPRVGEGPITNRALFERRTEPAVCASCHASLNPVGFAFEHYDATGAFRALDHGLPIDASGTLDATDPGAAYDDAIGLSEQIARSGELRACATRSWVRFALGRNLEAEDAHLRRLAVTAYDESGGDLRALMRAIATSPEMRMSQVEQE